MGSVWNSSGVSMDSSYMPKGFLWDFFGNSMGFLWDFFVVPMEFP